MNTTGEWRPVTCRYTHCAPISCSLPQWASFAKLKSKDKTIKNYSYFKQRKMSFFKNGRQEGKTVSVWGLAPMGGGK
jgi:hypothetical protein